MRLPTLSQFKFETQNISKQFESVSRLQAQIATGKKLLESSDDPLLAERIQSISSYVSRLKDYTLNSTLAENRTNGVDSALQEASSINSRVHVLILKAQNEVLSDADRQNIAQELDGCLTNLLNTANTVDGNGEYIFSGFNVTNPAYINEAGQFIYQGGQERGYVAISDQTNVPYTDSGYHIFGDIKSGNGTFSTSSNMATNTGTGVISPGRVSNNALYVPDEYSITFVTNSDGQLAYQVVGTNSGQVIPVPPLTSPSDAVPYVPGTDIIFAGLDVQIGGQPNVGDTFSIAPSQPQSIFATIQNIINVLNVPVGSEKNKADLQQNLGQQLASFQQAINHLRTAQTDAGSWGKIIDNQILINKNLIVDEEILLSNLSDVDLTHAISSLTQQLTTLQVAQESYMKIQQTFFSFFNR